MPAACSALHHRLELLDLLARAARTREYSLCGAKNPIEL